MKTSTWAILIAAVSVAACIFLYTHELKEETRRTVNAQITADEQKERMAEFNQMTLAQQAAVVKADERRFRSLQREYKRATAAGN